MFWGPVGVGRWLRIRDVLCYESPGFTNSLPNQLQIDDQAFSTHRASRLFGFGKSYAVIICLLCEYRRSDKYMESV